MKKTKMLLAAVAFGLANASSAWAADVGDYGICTAADSSTLMSIQSNTELTDEVVRLMNESVAVADSDTWIDSTRPAFVWASEAKVACGKAYGYLRANYRDQQNLNKCECFHARMVQYMN